MRAMAILYIGPHRNPDFATDYHLSPILAPAHLLAQFPPLLLQCGEKDPFVDDTVIFAGRVREAKRARKHELELAISGKSARFGESLRMSGIEASPDGKSMAAMKKEREKLARETEDDWVQMVLFSDWSHGYLQMPTLMSEAKAVSKYVSILRYYFLKNGQVIEELAEWIDDAFSRNVTKLAQPVGNGKGKECVPPTLLIALTSSETETDDPGIIFVPKKYQNGTSPAFNGEKIGIVKPEVINELHREDSSDDSDTYLSDRTASPTLIAHDERISVDAMGPSKDGYLVQRSTPQPPDTPRAAGPRQAGTQITETELMRRRRLLDSHIFEQ